MKKITRILLLFVLIISLLSSCRKEETPPAQWDWLNNQVGSEDALLTFCAMSDIHMGAAQTETKLGDALIYLQNLRVPPEAYLMVGDLTDTTGSTAETVQIQTLKSVYEQYEDPERLFYCLGPTHDVSASANAQTYRKLYSDTFGEDYFEEDTEETSFMLEKGLRHRVINGFHFFAIDWEGETAGALSYERQKWLKTKLDEAAKENAEKPIFVISHVPGIADSILRFYPQVVSFSGHVHNSAAREDSISQDQKFTNVHCGGMNYYRVTGYDRFTSNPYEFLGTITDFGQAIYVQVDRDYNVTITRLDVFHGTPIEQEWVVGPERRNVYISKRKKTAQPCTFTDESAMKVIENGTHVSVSWDACKKGEAGPPLYYQVSILVPDENGVYQVLDHKELSSQQVFYPNDEEIPSLHFRWTFRNKDSMDDYAITVEAYDCWQESGNALVYTNGTYVHDKPVSGTVQAG